jgi:hypothetical protein
VHLPCIYSVEITHWTTTVHIRSAGTGAVFARQAVELLQGFALHLQLHLRILPHDLRYQGDLSASINDALLAVNLNTVKLVTLQGKKKQTARETQVVILRQLIQRLHRVAEACNCSVNQLVNSGLAAHYSKEQSGRFGIPSRPTQRA